ncbi:cellulose biosynthesis protein BcsD [Pseudomonas sp. Marseille-QA0892]
MISEQDIQHANLAYYGNQYSNKQWRHFVMTLVQEMYASAGAVDACAFLRHVGGQLARANPVGEQPSLDGLQIALNEVLQTMDWGWVRFALDNQAVRIVHGAYPGITETAKYWGPAMGAVLEGMYQVWFQAQAEDVNLKVQCIATSPNGALVFRCGS